MEQWERLLRQKVEQGYCPNTSAALAELELLRNSLESSGSLVRRQENALRKISEICTIQVGSTLHTRIANLEKEIRDAWQEGLCEGHMMGQGLCVDSEEEAWEKSSARAALAALEKE